MSGASLAQALQALHQFAPPSLAESWDRSGLQVGDPAARVRSALVALDPSERAVAEAVARRADLLLTHHPLFLKFPDALDLSRPPARLAASLIRHNVALVSLHTNFDRAQGGVNDLLAGRLGLADVAPLGAGEALRKIAVTIPAGHEDAVRQAMADAGAGRLGAYAACSFEARGVGRFTPLDGASPFLGSQGREERVEEVRLEMLAPASRLADVLAALRKAHPYEAPAIDVYPIEGTSEHGAACRVGLLSRAMPLRRFAGEAARLLDAPGARFAGDPAASVRRVAVCGGSGSDFWPLARAAGADVLLTGDVRHHTALAAVAEGFALVDAGHGPTEAAALEGLAGILRSWSRASGAGIQVDVFYEPDPFSWVVRGAGRRGASAANRPGPRDGRQEVNK